MYQKNLLAKPGGLVIDNVPIDLAQDQDRRSTCRPRKEDHIAPAKSVYKATQLFCGPVRFMLAGSGHIAGVINPPAAKKYQHWLNETAKNPPTLEEWRAGADRASRLVVERLGQVAVGEVRRQGPGARAGQRRPARDRGRAGQLREGAADRLARSCFSSNRPWRESTRVHSGVDRLDADGTRVSGQESTNSTESAP